MISRGVLLEQPMPKNAVVDHSDKDGVLRPVCVRSSLLGGPVPQGRECYSPSSTWGLAKSLRIFNSELPDGMWHAGPSIAPTEHLQITFGSS